MGKNMGKRKTKIYAVDWGHKEDREEWHNGEHLETAPELKKGDIVLIENIPDYKSKELHGKGVKILMCHTMSTKEHREELGYPRLHHYKNKGHRVDAMVIYDLYQKKPGLFYPWRPNLLRMLYSDFSQIQKARIASFNRAWVKEAKEATSTTIEFLKKAEKELEKAMDKAGKGNIVYEYLRGIQGIGPRTGCGVIGAFDATKFDYSSKLRKYTGLAVIDGKIQRLRKGETTGYDTQKKALLIKRIADSFIKLSGTPHPSAYFLDYEWEKNRQQKKPAEAIPIHKKELIIGDLLAEDVGGFKECQRIYAHQYPKLLKQLNGQKTVLIKLSDGHIHNRAIRRMIQLFISDYWVVSRQLQGFSTNQPYPIKILGHSDYRKPRYIPEILKPFEPERDWGWVFNEGLRNWSDALPIVKEKCGKL